MTPGSPSSVTSTVKVRGRPSLIHVPPKVAVAPAIESQSNVAPCTQAPLTWLTYCRSPWIEAAAVFPYTTSHCRPARVVAYGAPPGEAPGAASVSAGANNDSSAPNARHWAWAALMRRAFDIDVLACPRCGGRLRLIATVEDPGAIRAILAAVASSEERADRAPPCTRR